MAKKAGVKESPVVGEKKNYLRNVKVKVKPIVRERAFFPKGHDGEFMYSGCTTQMTLPYSNKTRSYVNVFSSDEEREFFEDAINREHGELSVFSRTSDFWGKEFSVTLDKNEKELDLSNPMQMLEYKVLLANSDKIAPSWSERFVNPGYRWAVVSSDQEDDESYKAAAKNEHAMELFFKIKNSDKKMYDILRLLGKNPPKSSMSNTVWLKSQLDQVISQKEKIKGVPNIDDFIRIAEDPTFSEKVFVLDAMDINEIILDGGTYRIRETNAPIGRSIDQCVTYFADPRYNEEKILIEQRMELNK